MPKESKSIGQSEASEVGHKSSNMLTHHGRPQEKVSETLPTNASTRGGAPATRLEDTLSTRLGVAGGTTRDQGFLASNNGAPIRH